MKTRDIHYDGCPPHWEPYRVQDRYARVMAVGVRLGLVLLLCTFVPYVAGVTSPGVPLDRLPAYWNQPVGEYAAAVNRDFLKLERPPVGWDWLRLLHTGHFVNLVGICVLAGVTVFCYAAVLPLLIRQRRRVYALGAVLEILLLLAAASGLPGGGH